MVIRGETITLRPATMEDRRPIYEWMANSDATAAMMGPPLFPETPIPTWEEFLDDYEEYFFDGSRPEQGRCFVIEVEGERVGQTNYYALSPGVVELDIWLVSEGVTGRGYGTDALVTLCRHLHEALGTTEFVIRPSARNPRAVRAYEKAGFERTGMSLEEHTRAWGEPDYDDAVPMRRSIA
jgi:diamine N-acetyltransferase